MTKEHKIEIQSEPETPAAEAAAAESETMPPTAVGHAPQDDVSKPSAEAPSASDGTEESATLQTQLEKARAEAQDHYERFLRTAAELDNFRKRKEREVSDLRKYANQNLLKDLLSVVDNLERAIDATSDASNAEGLLEGVDMTLKELLKIFEKSKVKPIAAIDQPFDPSLHEAVMQEECADVPENTVIRELQKGYQLHDRLLRPAMVVVSR
ncbi:MAG: nucleotide exchange factor GrpE [Desulfosarcina sp.]|nr:nucleotide exchange factor GrpE [Desulfobacterales bacterium]